MEQAQRGVPEDAAIALGAESIGTYLARQRALRGISLEELAEITRIPLRSLRRLEAGAFDREPDGFVRGFVRTVASALGLPPDETVARMLPEVVGGAGGRGRLHSLLHPALVALIALLSIAAGSWALLDGRVLPAGWSRSRDELVHRRDAVRALAAERGLLTQPDRPAAAQPPAPSVGLGPRPSTVREPARPR